MPIPLAIDVLHGPWVLKVPELRVKLPMRLRRTRDHITTTGRLRDGTPVAVETDTFTGDLTAIYVGSACFVYEGVQRRKIAGEYSDPCLEGPPVAATLRKRR